MSTTLVQLRTSIRNTLRDSAVWRDSTLTAYIQDAVKDYSSIFPLEASVKIDCTDGTREYDLSTDCGYIMSILAVEYPKGTNPRKFLTRLRESSSSFLGGEHYDLRGTPVNTLVIGQDPTAAYDIQVTYTTMHTSPGSDSDVLTVPDEHLEALRLYVLYRAAQQLETDQASDVNRKYQMMGQMITDSKTAWNRYRSKISELRRWQALGGYVGPWKMDKKDRSY